METSEGQSLRILIVGAGIGGLTAGLAFRRNGHEVTLFEASKFSNETGAAVHLAPNCSGLLKRLGIKPENYGANICNGMMIYTPSGDRVYNADFRASAGQWQNPWLMIHRGRLHAALREKATAAEGPGEPCILKLSSRVEHIDIENGNITTNGEVFHGDVIVGADGVHSQARKSLFGDEKYAPFDAGSSMFRWLVPVEDLRKDPVTDKLIGPPGTMVLCLGGDRRIVAYPCNDNTVMNCGLIHPSKLSPRAEGDWNSMGDKNQMLQITSSFGPDLQAFLQKAPEDSLKLWTLLDMPVLNTWTRGKLVLLGDAAHPFLPHQAQGGAQAIEDAVSLATVLPLGTPQEDIIDRLELYVRIRKDRADKIQNATRMSSKLTSAAVPGIRSPNDYNYGHDEWHNSINALKNHLLSKKPFRSRQPLGFGPAPGPSQPLSTFDLLSNNQHRVERCIRFKTSRTYLQNLLQPCFKFSSAATVIQASLVCTSFKNVQWLGGRGYDIVELRIHGVEHTGRNGDILHGTFLLLTFGNSIDAMIAGREESGVPGLGCDISIKEEADSSIVQLSWGGSTFGELTIPNEHSLIEELPKPKPDTGTFMWRYIPAVGQPGEADAEYAVFQPSAEYSEASTENVSAGEGPNEAVAKTKYMASNSEVLRAPKQDEQTKPSISFRRLDWEQLPTLHHIASTLSEIPIYGIVESYIVRRDGMPDLSTCRRVE